MRKSTSQATKSCQQRDVFRKLDRVLNPSACVKVPVSHLPEQLWASLPCSGDFEILADFYKEISYKDESPSFRRNERVHFYGSKEATN